MISLESLNALPKLQTLRMSYNRLETLRLDRPNNDSYGFSNLSTLYLDHNLIGSITSTDDGHLFPTLKHLFLHHNRLANVYGNASFTFTVSLSLSLSSSLYLRTAVRRKWCCDLASRSRACARGTLLDAFHGRVAAQPDYKQTVSM